MAYSYSDDALEMLRRRGATWVRFWCLIAQAIRQWGEGTMLVMLARRARCAHCRRRGAHVDVEWETPPGAGVL